MNFEWKNDIYKDKHSKDSENTEYQEEEYLLPNFCKPIGILIALAPIFLRASQLYFPISFFKSLNYSDLVLLGVIVFGVMIEARSKARVENTQTQIRRSIVTFILLIVSIRFISPLWHWIF